MRRAKYSAKKVYLPNATSIGYCVKWAKPGYWIMWNAQPGVLSVGRVLGRIEWAQFNEGNREDVRGYLAVMALADDCTHAYVRWVAPKEVACCQEKPPRALLDWITGDKWAKRGADVGWYIALAEHGTTSDSYIATRDDPAKAYNARPEYVAQFIIK